MATQTKSFVIVTYGTAMGKHTRTVSQQTYASREEAQVEIDDRAALGDEAARDGRMKIEEAD